MLDLDNTSHNCIITLTQGQGHSLHMDIFLFPDHYLSLVTWMGMILHTIVDHDTGVVVAGGICPVMTCLVLFYLFIFFFGRHIVQ